jgi:hypothetical protein
VEVAWRPHNVGRARNKFLKGNTYVMIARLVQSKPMIRSTKITILVIRMKMGIPIRQGGSYD